MVTTTEKVPLRAEALRILREAGCSRDVIAHCKAVAALAVRIAENCQVRGLEVNLELVEAGALLHDVGRAFTHGIDHAIVGAKLAESRDLSPSVIRIIERHMGAGITADEAVKLGLPNMSLVPETLEEKIVSYADKRVEGRHYVEIEETIQKFADELGPQHPAIQRLRALHGEFSSLVEEQ